MRDLAQVVMANYHFWYHDQMDVTSQVRRCDDVWWLRPLLQPPPRACLTLSPCNRRRQVFWTENHIIMSQSSEFLLRGFLGMPVPPDLLRRLETYLDLKLSLGMAEFLSPVYYPFTIVSLLNLYDYALPAYEPLKQRCVQLLDRMSHQVSWWVGPPARRRLSKGARRAHIGPAATGAGEASLPTTSLSQPSHHKRTGPFRLSPRRLHREPLGPVLCPAPRRHPRCVRPTDRPRQMGPCVAVVVLVMVL